MPGKDTEADEASGLAGILSCGCFIRQHAVLCVPFSRTAGCTSGGLSR